MATVMYPYDDTGTAPSNLVKDEIQVLTASNNDPYRYFIPMFAPFYTTNFEMFGKDALGSERKLEFGIDYNFNLLYIGATRGNGSVVYGAVEIINAQIQGPVRLNYQCLGGKYSADRDYVVQVIAEQNYNPRVTAWDQVTSIQELFPPSNHPQDLDTFTGYRDLIDSIDRLDGVSDTQVIKDLIWSHILNHDDPHETIKHLGDYALKTYVNEAIAIVNGRIDQANSQINTNSQDILNLQRLVEEQRISLQQQISDNNQAIIGTNIRIDQLENTVQINSQKISEVDNRLTPKVEKNIVDIERLRQDLNAATGGQSQVVDELIIKVDKNTSDIRDLNTRLTNSEIDTATKLQDMSDRIDMAAGALTTDIDVPIDKTSTMILVMSPHLRFMVWDSENEKYVRAPWHLPGILQYSYTNPTNGMTGYLPVRGDIAYEKALYPDLVELLGLDQDGGTFNLVEMRGEFLRVLDNGRGIDLNRVNQSWQKATLVAGYDDNSTDGDISVLVNHLQRDYGTDPIQLSDYDISQCTYMNTGSELSVSVGANPATWYSATRPRNIAVPLWISI